MLSKIFSYYQFINESLINISDDLIVRLNDFKSDNSSDSKIKNIIDQLLNLSGKDLQSKRLNKDSHIVGFSSYSDKMKLDKSDIKIGRLLTTLLPDLSDSDREYFVNKYKSFFSDDKLKFHLVNGEDIGYWYQCYTYYEEKGILGSSCMRDAQEDTFNIYSKNSNVEMLILIDDNDRLHGRALVWNINGVKVMDRVYIIDDSDYYRFIEYAKTNGWAHREDNKAGSSDFTRSGKKFHGVVELEKVIFRYYPYVDTFKYLNLTKRQLSTKVENDWKNDAVVLLSTEYGSFIDLINFDAFIEMILREHLGKGGTWKELFSKNKEFFLKTAINKRRFIENYALEYINNRNNIDINVEDIILFLRLFFAKYSDSIGAIKSIDFISKITNTGGYEIEIKHGIIKSILNKDNLRDYLLFIWKNSNGEDLVKYVDGIMKNYTLDEIIRGIINKSELINEDLSDKSLLEKLNLDADKIISNLTRVLRINNDVFKEPTMVDEKSLREFILYNKFLNSILRSNHSYFDSTKNPAHFIDVNKIVKLYNIDDSYLIKEIDSKPNPVEYVTNNISMSGNFSELFKMLGILED